MQKKWIAPALIAALVLSLALTGCGSPAAQDSSDSGAQTSTAAAAGQSLFAGGSGTADDPWQVVTAEQLGAVRNDLTASYVLTADIDLDGAVFDPIGTFEPKSDAQEDAEAPKDAVAFTGYFDGGGHKISHLTVSREGQAGVGLFGCVTGVGAGVGNLTLENLAVTGGSYTGGAVGYGDYGAEIRNITLAGENSVTGLFLVGGVVGAAHCDIVGCSASADIVLSGENTQGAGIVVGGEEDGSVEGCTATGTVTAGDGAFSVGGLAGCFHNSAYAKSCTAADITITVGENSWLIGGLSGHAGTFEGDPTAISGCAVKNVTIRAADSAERIGGVVGGGFYASQYAQYYAEPSAVNVSDCTVEDTAVIGGRLVGSVLGYAYDNSAVRSCPSAVTWNGSGLDAQVGGDSSIPLGQLC